MSVEKLPEFISSDKWSWPDYLQGLFAGTEKKVIIGNKIQIFEIFTQLFRLAM